VHRPLVEAARLRRFPVLRIHDPQVCDLDGRATIGLSDRLGPAFLKSLVAALSGLES
jgi:hypothetical protein